MFLAATSLKKKIHVKVYIGSIPGLDDLLEAANNSPPPWCGSMKSIMILFNFFLLLFIDLTKLVSESSQSHHKLIGVT